ncbi:hypothetical protein ACVRXS_02060 [Streptococcus orisratti]
MTKELTSSQIEELKQALKEKSNARHHIREYRYCYGAVDAHTGDSFSS